MSRIVSLNARLAHDAQATPEFEVVLVKITHDDLSEPIRLSTDPTVRLADDPLKYGTLSTWLTTDSSPFEFILMSALLPDDKDDLSINSVLIIDNVSNDIATLLRGIQGRAAIDMAVVMASSPNQIEAQFLGLELSGASGEEASYTLNVSRDVLSQLPLPFGRMTKNRFPGLYR